MKFLSHQEDEVICLMQALDLLFHFGFTVKYTQVYFTHLFKKQEYEIHLVDSYPWYFSYSITSMCNSLSQELGRGGTGVKDTVQNM